MTVQMASEKLTDYERRRLENIKRNEEMLAALKIQSRVSDLSAVTKRPRAQSKSYLVTPQKKQQRSTSPVVLRRSLRTQGVSPDASTAGGLIDGLDDLPSKKTTRFKRSQLMAKKSPQEPTPISIMDAYCGDFDDSNEKLIETIKGFSGDLKEERKKSTSRIQLESLRLEPDNVARVVPGRILNVRFYPTNSVRMVAVGNKYGNIGLWNVDASEEDGDGIYLYHAHPGPVSGIVVNPFSLSQMLTSCYDGFIRTMDIEKELFLLVYLSDHAIFSLSQQPDDANSLYFGEGSGELGIWDLRAGKKSSPSLNLHDVRINTIDFASENSNIMATSSSDGTACIWDLRKVGTRKPECLRTVFHERAVHSAYFSPSGRFLATTSVDCKVGLISGANYEDASMVNHYNHTTRLISSFRGIWGWDDSYIYIGNMDRGVDVISVADKRLDRTLRSEYMSAIPCRFDAHPGRVGTLAGTTAGGQVYIWTPSS